MRRTRACGGVGEVFRRSEVCALTKPTQTRPVKPHSDATERSVIEPLQSATEAKILELMTLSL